MAATTSKKIEERNEAARKYLCDGEKPELEDLSKGELLAACRHNEEPAHRGMSSQDLIRILEGRDVRRRAFSVDEIRNALIGFLHLYWDRIKNQLPEQCDGDCYHCGDAKVLACYRDNREHLFKDRK